MRIVLPLVAAVVCFVVAYRLPPIGMYALTMVAFGFVLDAATSMWPKGDRLTKHRQ